MFAPPLDASAYLPFRGSPRPTLGVEMELQIVDPETARLQHGSLTIMDRVGDHPCIKPELTQSTIEIITGICDTVAEACDDLRTSMRTLYEIGDAEGFTFAAAGTHPFGTWHDQRIYPNERYQALVDRIQWAARRLTIYGLHVHVGVSSGERAIAIGNAMTRYLPHLLALSASSPFNEGEDTGLDSARVKIFEVMPTAGLPDRLSNYGAFQAFMNALISADAITSIREIWWDIRPHPGFGTVEVRICDVPSSLTDLAPLVALTHALIVHLDHLYEMGRPVPLLHPWIVRENKWRAARFGLEAKVIVDNEGTQVALREELADLVTGLAPQAEALGCAQELASVTDLLVRGNSTMQQRAWYAEHGSFVPVVQGLTNMLRESVEQPVAGRA